MELVMMANPKGANAPSVVVFLIQFPPPSLSHCGGGEGKVCSSGIFDTFFRALLAFENCGNTTFPAHKERLIQNKLAGGNATRTVVQKWETKCQELLKQPDRIMEDGIT